MGIKQVLKECHHVLTSLDGLIASDGLRAYGDAQRAGCDSNAAWDRFVEETWRIDNKVILRRIEEEMEDGNRE